MLTKKKILTISVIILLSIGIVGVFTLNKSPEVLFSTPKVSTMDYQMTSISNYTFGGSIDARGMHIVDDYMYIVSTNYFLILDISDPYNPAHVGNVSIGLGLFGDVFVVGEFACISGTTSDFKIVNVSDPVNPLELDQYHDGGLAWGIYAEGNYAYVASESAGLEVINITDPLNVDEIGDYDDVLGLPYDVQVVGNYAYVADWSSGLEVLDITDPTSPTQIAQVANSTDQAWGIYVSGDYAYIADWNLGLRIFDISTPSSPVELWQSGGIGFVEDVWIEGDYAFVVDRNSNHLHVFNVTNKLAAYLAGEFTISDAGYDVEVHGNHVYVLGENVLRILEGMEVEHSYALTSPTASTSWNTNTTQDITWTSQGEVSSILDIDLYRYDTFLQSIAIGTPNDGAYAWLIPLELADSGQYQIKITDVVDDTATGMSAYFEIKTPQDKRIPGFNVVIILGLLGAGISVFASRVKRSKI